MVLFDLNPEGLQVDGDWKYIDMSLMIPQGYTKSSPRKIFKGIVSESGADGGSYNEVLCRLE